MKKQYMNSTKQIINQGSTPQSMNGRKYKLNNSLQSRSINSLSLRPKSIRAQTRKEFTISLLEYCSHEIGLSCYNNSNGEFFLCQFVENMTYFKTISIIEAFNPIQIIYPVSLSNTLLLKILQEYFVQCSFKPFLRKFYDTSNGEILYKQTTNQEDINSQNKFLAFACFNALILYLENKLQIGFQQNSLKVTWHRLEQLLIIQPDAIVDLQLFYTLNKNNNRIPLVNQFKCITYGGTRMLRANFLQPPSSERIILQRQKLVEQLLSNPFLTDAIQKQFYKFKNYEPITAKFISHPKNSTLKSLKPYLSSIYSLANFSIELNQMYKIFHDINAFSLPIFDKLDEKLQHHKLKLLKNIIQENFDERILQSFHDQQGKKKRDKFIFLFKADKMESESEVICLRNVYNRLIDQVYQHFEEIKHICHGEAFLMHNDYRGFFVKSKSGVNLQQVSTSLGQNLHQAVLKNNYVTFCTQTLLSLNNRLKQNEKSLIFMSEILLRSLISQIQENISILFQINNLFSTIDMVRSYVRYIEKYSLYAKFVRPVFVKGVNKINLQSIKTVWSMTGNKLTSSMPANKYNQSDYQILEEGLQQISINKSFDDKNIIILQKSQNSKQQFVYISSLAYCIILGQIGCFVPAEKVELPLFDTLLSKINIEEHVQLGMSRFQLTLAKIQNILQNSVQKKQEKCLILMDQIVKGTHYKQECSLSLGIINQLQRLNGVSFLCTSDRLLINNLKKLPQFQHVQIAQSTQYQSQQQIIEKMTRCALQTMSKYNFPRQFIKQFENIETIIKQNKKNYLVKKQNRTEQLFKLRTQYKKVSLLTRYNQTIPQIAQQQQISKQLSKQSQPLSVKKKGSSNSSQKYLNLKQIEQSSQQQEEDWQNTNFYGEHSSRSQTDESFEA